MKTKKTPSKKPATKGQKPRRLAPVPGSAPKAPYLTQVCYIRELVPLHVIAALSDVDGDAEMKALCREVTQSMLRLRDKLAGRPVRPNVEVSGPPPMTPECKQSATGGFAAPNG